MYFYLISKNTAPRRARLRLTSTKSHRAKCQATRTNSSPHPQCDGISLRSAGAMSIGIPPLLTLSETLGALRDKSGALQNPDRLASSLEFALKSTYRRRNENLNHYCPGPSR